MLSGGVDGTAVVFNRSSGELVSTLSGHSKRVRLKLVIGCFLRV